MSRLTYYYSWDEFGIKGSKTLCPKNPPKTHLVKRALAKLFDLEEEGMDYEHYRGVCDCMDDEYIIPAKRPFKYCPYCGKEIGK